MGSIEDRQELMRIAKEMTQLGHELRAELKLFTDRGNLVTNKLVYMGDLLLPAVMDEREQQRGPKGKKIMVYAKGEGTSSVAPPIDPAQVKEIPKLAPGKRACSICRQPGHRRQNCPQADKAYKAARGKGKKK